MVLDKTSMEEETKKDVKAKIDNAEVEYVNLKVMSQDGSEINFRIKKHTSLKKLMTAFCSKTGMDYAYVRFHFDGERIQEGDSPEKLGMVDGDSIDVFQKQIAGRSALVG